MKNTIYTIFLIISNTLIMAQTKLDSISSLEGTYLYREYTDTTRFLIQNISALDQKYFVRESFIFLSIESNQDIEFYKNICDEYINKRDKYANEYPQFFSKDTLIFKDRNYFQLKEKNIITGKYMDYININAPSSKSNIELLFLNYPSCIDSVYKKGMNTFYKFVFVNANYSEGSTQHFTYMKDFWITQCFLPKNLYNENYNFKLVYSDSPCTEISKIKW